MTNEMKNAMREYVKNELSVFADIGVTDPELMFQEMLDEMREELITQIEENI